MNRILNLVLKFSTTGTAVVCMVVCHSNKFSSYSSTNFRDGASSYRVDTATAVFGGISMAGDMHGD